jgi:DNA-binding protein HU-beta
MIALKTELSKANTAAILNALKEVIREEVLDQGKTVRFSQFGIFKRKELPARTARNPKTGENILTTANHSVIFNVSSSLKVKF